MRRSLAPLRTPVLFTAGFALSSFLFSFLSWGRAAPQAPQFPTVDMDLVVHMAKHAALGALAALPTRRLSLITTAALSTMLLDVDHIGEMLGLPLLGRASHSVPFMAVAAAGLFLLARKGTFGRDLPPVLAASLVLASVLSHVTLDALMGDSSVPLWSPLSGERVALPAVVAASLELLALALVWVATTGRHALTSRPLAWHRQPQSNSPARTEADPEREP